MRRDRSLDRIDIRILAALQDQGRITNVRLAEAAGLSPSPCLERTRRLEDMGYVRRYRAELDVDRLAGAVTVLAQITLADHCRTAFDGFEAALRAVPEVVECFKTGGGFDYLARFVCRDLPHYHAVSERLLSEELGVRQCFSYVVIETVKPFAGYPVAALLENPVPA